MFLPLYGASLGAQRCSIVSAAAERNSTESLIREDLRSATIFIASPVAGVALNRATEAFCMIRQLSYEASCAELVFVGAGQFQS